MLYLSFFRRALSLLSAKKILRIPCGMQHTVFLVFFPQSFVTALSLARCVFSYAPGSLVRVSRSAKKITRIPCGMQDKIKLTVQRVESP
jgi:hypothetical protein